MPDPVVERWKQEDPIYLWRYTVSAQNYLGWHLTASDASCRSIGHLLDLMCEAEFPSRKELRVTRPTPAILNVPNHRRGDAEWSTADSILLKYPKGQLETNHWQADVEHSRLVLTLGEERIHELRTSVAELRNGRDDFCIGPSCKERGGECLWFWNFPEH